jgi:tRNA pseudouridine(38-40) synthase
VISCKVQLKGVGMAAAAAASASAGEEGEGAAAPLDTATAADDAATAAAPAAAEAPPTTGTSTEGGGKADDGDGGGAAAAAADEGGKAEGKEGKGEGKGKGKGDAVAKQLALEAMAQQESRALAEAPAAINAHLPPGIQVLAMARVTKSFHAKGKCTRRRYCYMLPTFVLEEAAVVDPLVEACRGEFPPEDPDGDGEAVKPRLFPMDGAYPPARVGAIEGVFEKLRGYRVPAAKMARLREVLGRYQGTHNFHNFTTKLSYRSKQAQRRVVVPPPPLLPSHGPPSPRTLGLSTCMCMCTMCVVAHLSPPLCVVLTVTVQVHHLDRGGRPLGPRGHRVDHGHPARPVLPPPPGEQASTQAVTTMLAPATNNPGAVSGVCVCVCVCVMLMRGEA